MRGIRHGRHNIFSRFLHFNAYFAYYAYKALSWNLKLGLTAAGRPSLRCTFPLFRHILIFSNMKTGGMRILHIFFAYFAFVTYQKACVYILHMTRGSLWGCVYMHIMHISHICHILHIVYILHTLHIVPIDAYQTYLPYYAYFTYCCRTVQIFYIDRIWDTGALVCFVSVLKGYKSLHKCYISFQCPANWNFFLWFLLGLLPLALECLNHM